MNNFIKNISTSLLIALMMFSASFQAIADDTEIFFSSVSLAGSTSIQPNVLMVLDTSSSMNNIVDEDGNPNFDAPFERTRLEHMKEAMQSILDNANNINVGIMRFHGRGGPVLFPVADINADVSTVSGVTSTGIPQTFNRIENSSDDVEEINLPIFPDFVYSDDELTMGDETILVGACGNPANSSVSIRINDRDDDVEEDDDGDVDENSSDLELVYDGEDQHVGLRFNGVNIPPSSNIICAHIDFEIDEREDDDTDLDIFIQNIGNAPAFNDGNNTYDVTGRISAGDASVSWDDAEDLPVNAILTSPDIGSLVQNVVSRADWASGNSMAFIINGSGERVVESYNGEQGGAALLRVEYASPAAGLSGNQRVGLRFSDVKIPQGATITAAFIDFTSVNETEASSSVINIHAEDSDDSSPFVLGFSNDLQDTRVASGADTASSPLVWTPSAWDANTLYSTPDIKDLVQDIVDRGNWCGGNAMSFIFDAQQGTRKAVSDDANESISPALRIEYDESTATGCTTVAVQAQISTGNDDAEERTSDGSISFSSSDIELNQDGSNSQIVGLRFQDINVSSADTVVSAELEFTVDEVDTSSTSVTIYGEYAGDSQAFSSTNKISPRTKTSASVNWSPGAWTTPGSKQISPDISSIVQEIVGHSGWSALNNMSFIIEGTAGERTAESYNGEPINAAILRINIRGSGTGGSAGTITVRERLSEIVDEIAYIGGTPIVDTLYEAGSYYRGDDVLFGLTRGGGAVLTPSDNVGSRARLTRVSHEASYTGPTPTRDGDCNADNLSDSDCVTERIEGDATYISPIEFECQDNHIIFLSDGNPSRWNLNEVSSPYLNLSSCDVGGDRGRCGEEIVAFLQDNDQIDDSTLDDDQKITTHTIGFNFAGSTYLEDLATAGGGGFYEASTASQLTTVFTQIFADVLSAPTSFVAPAVSINTFNRLTHRDELYFALFEPEERPRWAGNMKRYRLDTSGTEPMVVDVLGNPAVSSVTGFFTSGARSWWSDVTDGADINEGGFAGEVGTSRNIYTFTGTNTLLSDSSNHIKDSNSALTDGMLNIVSEQALDPNYRANLLSWLDGVDVQDDDEDNSTTDARQFVGDPLHSRPAIVTYGGTIASPDTTAYFGTNEGFLHAVNTETGAELFSFMPQELLSNAKLLFTNQGTPADHYYGMDGTITAWVNDVNDDRQVVAADGDHVYLYAGMRRGGSQYYALDVTDRTNPKLLWTIQGGAGDFVELGQTWSQPVKSRVTIGGTTSDVLIFTGGYDENQDNATTPQNDNIGRALYIVDAFTGARLWWAGPVGSGANLEVADLDNSMPASPSVIDLGVDGIADHVYIGDTGGRVWRFNFTNGDPVNTFGSATLLATLGDTDADASNDLENNRRFYHTPTVAFKAPLSSQTLQIAIGSGFHAHPLNQDVHDRFYVLEDTGAINASSMTTITESSLFDATSNVIQDGTDDTTISNAVAARNSASGWYLRLEEDSTTQIGEKALASATIFAGVLLFTTYLPENPGATTVAAACQAAAGFGRAYAVNLDDGTSVFNFSSTVAGLDKNDRYVQLNHVGIPPEVQIIIPGGGSGSSKKPVVLVGTEVIEVKKADGSNGFDELKNEIIFWRDDQ